MRFMLICETLLLLCLHSCRPVLADQGVYRFISRNTDDNLLGLSQCISVRAPDGRRGILTCSHCVSGHDRFAVVIDDGEELELELQLIAKDWRLDAAWLWSPDLPSTLPAWSLADLSQSTELAALACVQEGGAVPCRFIKSPRGRPRIKDGYETGEIQIACRSGDSGGAVTSGGYLVAMISSGGGEPLQWRCVNGQCSPQPPAWGFSTGIAVQPPLWQVPPRGQPVPQRYVRQQGSTSVIRATEIAVWLATVPASGLDLNQTVPAAGTAIPTGNAGKTTGHTTEDRGWASVQDQLAVLCQRVEDLASRSPNVGPAGPQGPPGPPGAKGERGPAGLPGANGTDGGTVSAAQIEAAVARYLQEHPQEVISLGQTLDQQVAAVIAALGARKSPVIIRNEDGSIYSQDQERTLFEPVEIILKNGK